MSENAGLKAETILAGMYAKVAEGQFCGIDVRDGKIKESIEANIMDPYESKTWALKLAFDVCLTLLKVD